MDSLFNLEPMLPIGFKYHPDFISEKEESELITAIRNVEFKIFNFQGFQAKRKVASFGYDWSFEKRVLAKGKDISESFHWLIDKAAKYLSLNQSDFSEVLVTEYPVGSVINWHRDAPPFDTIIGISLLSDCIFKLKPYDKLNQCRKSIVSLPVQRRSLYVIRDESRTEWQHSIAPVKEMRYSITMRTLRRDN